MSKFRSNESLGEENGESRDQVQRFIRLTYLVPELLEFVDEGRIKMRPVVELSYLDEDAQRDVVDEIDLIGYLRADMGTDGNGFFSTWEDVSPQVKTDEFSAELDEVINSLREEGDILHDRRTLEKYCYSIPESKMTGEERCYGVRVDSDKYSEMV